MRFFFFFLLAVLGVITPLCSQERLVSRADSITIDSIETILLDGFYGGDYARSGELAEASLPYIGDVYGTEANEYGNWMDMIGVFWNHAGALTRALPFLEQSVAHARTYLGVKHEDYITRLSNLAMLNLDLGNSGLALTQQVESYELAKATLEKDNIYYGILVNNLALVYERLGMKQEALGYYYDALELTELVYGTEHNRYATRLNNIASIYRDIGQYAKAAELYDQSEAVYAATLDKSHASYINCLINRGQNYQFWGKYELALADLTKALELIPLALGEDHHYRIQALINLASINLVQGDYEEARKQIAKAEEKGIDFLEKNLYWASQLKLLSANCAEIAGDVTSASGHYQALADLFVQDTERQFDWLSQTDQQSFLANYSSVFKATSSFAFHHRDEQEIIANSFEMNLQLKELTLGYQRYLLKTLKEEQGNTALAQKFETWRELRSTIAKGHSGQTVLMGEELAELELQADYLERQLAAASTVFREACQVTNWETLRDQLAPGEVVIEFSHFDYQPQDRLTDSTYYVAYILRSRAPYLEMVPLFELGELPGLRRIKQLYQPAQTDTEACLQNLIAKPLLEKLGDAQTIYFSPTGLLHRVNFGAIPVSATETFSGRYELHQIGAVRQLEQEQKETGFAAPASALVYGGIVYDELDDEVRSSADGSRGQSVERPLTSSDIRFRSLADPLNPAWRYLDWSEREAEEVSQTLRTSGTQVHLAKGKEATEEDFVQTCKRGEAPSLVHLATHGFFFPDEQPSEKRAFRAAAEPMIRSGVVLAGANLAWQGGEVPAETEDGILTAYEISLLDLSNTELVVLSACDTGLGELRDNEGVFGMQRAFKIAGANYLIMSLWDVPDRQTQEFMSTFYAQWLGEQQDIPTAFYQTQQLLKAKYGLNPGPISWAGFVLVE